MLSDRWLAEFWTSDSYTSNKISIYESGGRHYAGIFISCTHCVMFTRMGICVADLHYYHRRISIPVKFINELAWEPLWNCPCRKEGEQVSSFQKIYEKHAQPVYRFLLSLAGSEDLAEELLSETFYQAFRYIDRFEGRCSIYSWLCQIGKNAWLKECRRNKRYREIRPEDMNYPDKKISLEEQVINREMYRKVLEVVQRLQDPYRDVFILHAIGEVALNEIANIYDKSESWARVTYFRAKKMIAQEVSR